MLEIMEDRFLNVILVRLEKHPVLILRGNFQIF